MIVVDLGCYPHGRDISIEPLIDRFAPDMLYGFDPFLSTGTNYYYKTTRIELSPKAAWTEDGFVGFIPKGLRSRVFEFTAGAVPCFDLAVFIRELPDDDIVLKCDIEGAEMVVLPHLMAQGVDERLQLLLVEWHCENCGVGGGEHTDECELPAVPKLGGFRCPVEEWEHETVAA